MRLLPAILTFSSRVTPPEGLVVEGTFIPGYTKICAPRYTIGRRKWHLVLLNQSSQVFQWSPHMSTLIALFQRGGTVSLNLSRIDAHSRPSALVSLTQFKNEAKHKLMSLA
jgi:hypothetical protein